MSRSSYILHPVFLKHIKQKYIFSFLSLKIKILVPSIWWSNVTNVSSWCWRSATPGLTPQSLSPDWLDLSFNVTQIHLQVCFTALSFKHRRWKYFSNQTTFDSFFFNRPVVVVFVWTVASASSWSADSDDITVVSCCCCSPSGRMRCLLNTSAPSYQLSPVQLFFLYTQRTAAHLVFLLFFFSSWDLNFLNISTFFRPARLAPTTMTRWVAQICFYLFCF